MSLTKDVESLIDRQLDRWPDAAANYAALAGVKVKEFDVDGMCFKVQFNPARAVSLTIIQKGMSGYHVLFSKQMMFEEPTKSYPESH